ncbi:hypothetical protein GCM10010412_097700 [Nonomuraea recticatena]|uniref:Excreted virulence factor EspC (Type VII ESX diderm) n=1 Tax=Nonomuraea recticatena TaxID=46178 RepID=A0ABN3TCQ7_9ACTN
MGPDGELVSALNEFTSAMVEAADQRKRAYDATASSMSQSVNAVREADTSASTVANTVVAEGSVAGNTVAGDA